VDLEPAITRLVTRTHGRLAGRNRLVGRTARETRTVHMPDCCFIA
jgi:hypothetical protein